MKVPVYRIYYIDIKRQKKKKKKKKTRDRLKTEKNAASLLINTNSVKTPCVVTDTSDPTTNVDPDQTAPRKEQCGRGLH